MLYSFLTVATALNDYAVTAAAGITVLIVSGIGMLALKYLHRMDRSIKATEDNFHVNGGRARLPYAMRNMTFGDLLINHILDSKQDRDDFNRLEAEFHRYHPMNSEVIQEVPGHDD